MKKNHDIKVAVLSATLLLAIRDRNANARATINFPATINVPNISRD